MKVYAYERCSTCRRALAYLRATGRRFELLAIREQPPTREELRRLLKVYGGKVVRLFNTSGADYRAMKLGVKLKSMGEEQAIALLSGNGNLVRRPLVLVGNTGAAGFDVEEWKEKGIR